MIEARISGRVYKYFSGVNIDLKLNGVGSTFSFDGYFDKENDRLSKIFTPLSYNDCDIWAIDEEKGIKEKLITGTILNHGLSTQKKEELTNVQGYSVTGVFNDVNIPVEKYPLQYDGLSLAQITKDLCDWFGIGLVIFDNAKEAADKPFELTKAQPTETISEFLADIARSRGITLAHDNKGNLLLYKVLAQIPPKIKINEDDIKVISIKVKPNGQQTHSDITVIKQSSTDDQNEGQSTIMSPFVPSGIKRPKVQMLKYGKNADTLTAATSMVCVEAKNFPIIIELEGWTFQDKIVRSGFYIELTAPSIFISTTKLVLQSVNFKEDPQNGQTMTLTAVLPCVYTGVLPAKSPFK